MLRFCVKIVKGKKKKRRKREEERKEKEKEGLSLGELIKPNWQDGNS